MSYKYTAEDVLKASEKPGVDRELLVAYQLGLMASWIARLANEDSRVASELRARYKLNTANKGTKHA